MINKDPINNDEFQLPPNPNVPTFKNTNAKPRGMISNLAPRCPNCDNIIVGSDCLECSKVPTL